MLQLRYLQIEGNSQQETIVISLFILAKVAAKWQLLITLLF